MLYHLARGTVSQFIVPPELPTTPHLMRREGLKHDALDRDWVISESVDGKLDRSLVELFLPPVVWPFFWKTIEMGPIEWGYSVEQLMRLWAVGANIDKSERRPLVGATLNTFLVCQQRLGEQIVATRRWAEHRGVELAPEFAQWTRDDLPRFRLGWDYGGKSTSPTTKAPSLLHVRRALHGLDERVKATQKRKRRYGKRSIRHRALLGVVTTTGARASTIFEMTREHFLPAHRFPDGTIGPALHFTFFKGRPGVQRVQGIPPLVGEWIEEHIEAYRVREGQPLWTAQFGDSDSSASGLSRSIDTAMNAFADVGDDDRYGSHDLRRVAERYARRYGERWVRENESLLDHNGVIGFVPDGQTFADLLTDHRPGGVHATYKDLLHTAAVEHWARIAALGVWEYVWEDRGARKVPDLDAITRAHEALVDSRASQLRVETVLSEAKEQRAALRAVRRAALAVETDSQEGTIQALLAMARVAAEAEDLAEHVADAGHELSQAMLAVDQARRDLADAMRLRVAVSDFASDDEVADIYAIAEGYQEEAEDGDVRELAVRRSFTVHEMAWATGFSEAHMRRFFRGTSGFQCLFDQADDGGVRGVHRLSDRRQFANFDELPLERYPARIIERLQWLMRHPHGCPLPGYDMSVAPEPPQGRQLDTSATGLAVEGVADVEAFLDDTFSSKEAAALLGVSEPTPRNRLRAGRLVAFTDMGTVRFPKWQFDARIGGGVVFGIEAAITALGEMAEREKAVWFSTAHPALAGAVPAELLRAGELERVIAAAEGDRAARVPPQSGRSTLETPTSREPVPDCSHNRS